MARAEGPAASLLNILQAPFLGTAMGRGVLPDSHALNVNAARSTALAQADVAVIVGARYVVFWWFFGVYVWCVCGVYVVLLRGVVCVVCVWCVCGVVVWCVCGVCGWHTRDMVCDLT